MSNRSMAWESFEVQEQAENLVKVSKAVSCILSELALEDSGGVLYESDAHALLGDVLLDAIRRLEDAQYDALVHGEA